MLWLRSSYTCEVMWRAEGSNHEILDLTVLKVCSKIIGTDSCFCNKSLRLHRFPEFLRQLVDIVTYVIVIDNKIWKKNGKGRKNEEENLGLEEPLTLAPKKIYQHVSKFKICQVHILSDLSISYFSISSP